MEKLIILVNIHYLLFLRDIYEGHLSTEGANNKQSNFTNELKNFDKGAKILDKKYFLNNLGLLFSAREKVLNSFKIRLFPIKECEQAPDQAPEQAPKEKKSKIRLHIELINEIETDEKYINVEIFWKYFKYQTLLLFRD